MGKIDKEKLKKLDKELGKYFIIRVTDENLTPTEILTLVTSISCSLVDSLASTIEADPKVLLNAFSQSIECYAKDIVNPRESENDSIWMRVTASKGKPS